MSSFVPCSGLRGWAQSPALCPANSLIDGIPAPSSLNSDMEQFHGTTIMSARRDGKVALGGDGQVTLGQVVVKASARKVRRLYHDSILAGFAGGTADAFTLFERFEAKLDKHH